MRLGLELERKINQRIEMIAESDGPKEVGRATRLAEVWVVW